MALNSKNLLWDSNVFIRFLTQRPTEYVQDITDYIKDAKEGRRQIFYSTAVLGEVKPSHLKERGYGSWNEFTDDFRGAFFPADQTPNIMMDVGIIRDLSADNPDKPTEKKRVLSTSDATILVTGVHLIQVNDLKDLIFHTFDNGKGETWAGKCVPLLSFTDYYRHHMNVPLISAICAMPRLIPEHPQRALPLFGDGKHENGSVNLDPSGPRGPAH